MHDAAAPHCELHDRVSTIPTKAVHWQLRRIAHYEVHDRVSIMQEQKLCIMLLPLRTMSFMIAALHKYHI